MSHQLKSFVPVGLNAILSAVAWSTQECIPTTTRATIWHNKASEYALSRLINGSGQPNENQQTSNKHLFLHQVAVIVQQVRYP